MRIQELTERLQQLGVIVSEKTLRRWGESGIIKDHRPNLPITGRGNAEDWPEKALEEAAAVWASRECAVRKHKALTSEMIEVIKRAAAILDDRPFAVYTLPPVTGPLSTQQIAPEDIEMTFVSEYGLDFFPGSDNAKRAECFNELVVAWVAAVEKVRAWEFEGRQAYVREHHPDLGRGKSGVIAFLQIDPWRVKVPPPWRIDKPARVELHWGSKPSKSGFDRFPFQTLRKSKRDEIIHYENFIDTREFFRIDIGDRKGWASAKLEKIEHELEEKERELRRLGMENDTQVALFILAMKGRPFDTLREQEKLDLKTAQKLQGLKIRRARLRKSFGV